MPHMLGPFRLDSVVSGRFALDGGAMFGVVPRTLWEREMAPDSCHRIPLVTRSLVIQSDRRTILVDAGPGQRWSQKAKAIYGISVEEDVVTNLAAHGIDREAVTDVVITHLHWDHVGALVQEDGTLTFPRAVHHVQRRNWKWAHTPSERDRRSFRLEDLDPLEESGRLHFIEGETELIEGVALLPTEGHTVGQQLVRVTGEDGTVLHCADSIPTAAHVRLAWGMGYDLYPITVIEEKKQILAQALEFGWILFFPHDPRHAACTVREEAGQVVVDRYFDF